MKLLRSFPILAFALVLLSIVGLCVAQESVGLLLVAGALAVTSWYVTEGPRGRSLPGWVSNVLVLAVSLNVVVDLLQHREDFLGVLGRFTVWLTLIKLYERRTPRDYAHLLVLSLLLMLTACLQSSDLLFGVILVVYAVLGLYVLLLFQLHAAHERGKAARATAIPPAYRLVPPSRPVIGRHVGLQFRGLVVGIGLAGLLVSSMVFVLFPRGWGHGVVSMLAAPATGRRVGFSPEVNLLGSTRITESRAKVMEVRLRDADGRPVHPDAPLLLRGGVLERYDRGRWRSGDSRDDIESVAAGAPLGLELEGEDDLWRLEVELQMPTETLFLPATVVQVTTEHVERFDYDSGTQLVRAAAGMGRLRSYSALIDPAPSEAALERLTDWRPPRLVSSGAYRNRQVRALAEQLLRDAGLSRPARGAGADAYWRWNRAAAECFTEFLVSDAFAYTLDTSDVVYEPDEDPIAQFLTRVRRGHCEFYASGLAALCHAVGIRARLVTGYVAYEYDEERQQYVVLESNAHAWTEVATGPHRWTTFDPTPSDTLRDLHAGAATFSDRLRWIYQGLEGSWSSSIVEFDQRAQSDLAARLDRGWSDRLAGALDATRSWMRRVNRAFYFGPAGYIWMGIVALALVLCVIALVKLMRRTRRLRSLLRLGHLRGSEYQRLLRQLGFYLDMLRALERGGCGKPGWMPPRLFAERLDETRPAAAAAVREVTDVFYEARYGGRRLDPADVGRARALVEQLGRDLRTRR